MTVSFKKNKIGTSSEYKVGTISTAIAGGITRRTLLNITQAGVVTAPTAIPATPGGTTYIVAEDPVKGGSGAIGAFEAVCWVITDTDQLVEDKRKPLTLADPFKFAR